MKKDQIFYRALSILCLFTFVLSACSPKATPAVAPATSAPATSAPATSAAATSAPATSAPTTAAEPVTLTYLVDESQNTRDTTQALVDAYTAQHPNVTITIETRPGGTDGDNIVKTRLATGDMDDLFFYNSGSLLQALHPTDTLVDLSKEPFMANVVESFLPTVSQNGQVLECQPVPH